MLGLEGKLALSLFLYALATRLTARSCRRYLQAGTPFISVCVFVFFLSLSFSLCNCHTSWQNIVEGSLSLFLPLQQGVPLLT